MTGQCDCREAEGERIMTLNTAGERHFTEDGRIAENSFELVLRARAKMAEAGRLNLRGDDQGAPRNSVMRLRGASKSASCDRKEPPTHGEL